VLVLSGSLNKNVEREAIKRGAFRFIPKGTDINVLVAELWNAFLAGSVSLKSYRHEAAAVA
jgi:ActR/RegA family two-component response regulator